MITISIVSHGHGAMVLALIDSLLTCPEVSQIILTRNIPEAGALPNTDKLKCVDNDAPKGFGANHNAAFRQSTQPYFCPLNPDIHLSGNPFPKLLQEFGKTGTAVVAPLVLAPDGSIEDNVRRFPTPFSLLTKGFGGSGGRYKVTSGDSPFHPDWVAGMFLLFDAASYQKLSGFDEGYFLYYEDVDICARAWQSDMKVTACPSVTVTHDARRQSRRDWQHFQWHVRSMARYLIRHSGRLSRTS